MTVQIPQRLVISPAEAATLAGIGRTKLYEAIATGALRSFKLGRRRLIRMEALEDWLQQVERG